MDIELLSKMVKELILDNDKVTLPGLGSFVAEVAPSTFSDRGYTINPPYRKLSFKANVASDDLLVDFYASTNSITKEVAAQILGGFVREIASALDTTRMVQLPGLGRLRAGRDGNIFFIADEELDIYLVGFGLEPISLKTHVKPTSFDFSTLEVPVAPADAAPVDMTPDDVAPLAVAETVEEEVAEEPQVEESPAEEEPVAEEAPVETEEVPSEEAPVEEEPAEEPVAEEPVEEVAEETVETEEEKTPEEPIEEKKEAYVAEKRASEAYFVKDEIIRRKTRKASKRAPMSAGAKKAIAVVLGIVALLAIVVVGFIVMKEFFPDALDRLLYTKEELEILNYYSK